MKIAGLFLLALLLGSCMGSQYANDSPDVEFIEVPRTKIIHEPAPPPEQVAVFPDSCKDVLAQVDTIVRNAEEIYSSGQDQLAIFSDVRLYMAAHRSTDELETRQRRLHGRTVGNLLELERAIASYDSALAECRREQ